MKGEEGKRVIGSRGPWFEADTAVAGLENVLPTGSPSPIFFEL